MRETPLAPKLLLKLSPGNDVGLGDFQSFVVSFAHTIHTKAQ